VISGPREDVNKALEKALEDPVFASTLGIGFREPVTTIRLVRDPSPELGLAQRNNELSIKFADRIRDTSEALYSIEKQLCAHAALELLYQNLTSFVRDGPPYWGALHQIRPFLDRVHRTEVRSTRQAAEVIRTIIKADSKRLLKKGEELLRTLNQTAGVRLLTTTEACEKIDSVGRLSTELLALQIITESAIPAASKQRRETLTSIDLATTKVLANILGLNFKELTETLEQTTSLITARIGGLWAKALYKGTGHAIIECYQRALRRFNFPGFNAPIPDLLDPDKQPVMFQPTQPSLLPSLREPNSERFRATFQPRILRELPTLISISDAGIHLDQKLRAWSTTDPNPFGFLQERLLDVIRDVPAALKGIRADLPALVPQPLTDLLESICLLRHHGGEEGLAHFASLACRFSDQELKALNVARTALAEAVETEDDSIIAPRKEDLQSFLAGLAEEHASDYQSLIDFLAAWPLCKKPEERADLFNRNSAYFSSITISLLITITKGLEDHFRAVISENRSIPDELLGQLLLDAKGLGQAGIDLENPSVSVYIASVTTSLQDLITLMRIQLMPRDAQLGHLVTIREILVREREQLHRLPTPLPTAAASVPSFTDIVISVAQSLQAPLEGELNERAKIASEALQTAVDTGDFDRIAPAITEAVSCLPALHGTNLYRPLEDLINRSTISWINDIGTSLTKLGEALSRQLQESPKDNEVILAVFGGLRWHLRLAHDVRNIFSSTQFPDRAPRINHIDLIVQRARKQISTTMLSDEDRFARFITSLLHKLRSSNSEELLADAQEVAAIPIVPSNLKNKRTRELFEGLRAQVKQP
jgi:hypothetical protein